jgi:neuropilin and tolloid-like protein
VGHIIRVDFRDQFVIEPHEDCDYDFLEVRDGAHGYSPFMSRFCGRSFPPVITSSDRYLWLRFNTDDTVEYSGFRAVYQYIPDIGNCSMRYTAAVLALES